MGKVLRNAQIPPPANRRGGKIVQQLSTKLGNLHSFLLNCKISVYVNKKIIDAPKFFKTYSSSPPYYFLSHYITFSQIETGATVPLTSIVFEFTKSF
jgi:hypothetical protein